MKRLAVCVMSTLVMLAPVALEPAGAASLPGPVIGLEAHTGQRWEIVATWQAPPNDGGSPIVGYRVFGISHGFAGIPFTTTDTTAVVTGQAGSPVGIVVTALTSVGEGPNSSATARAGLGAGYWAVDVTGASQGFGDAAPRSVAVPAGVTAVAAASTADGFGLYVLGSDDVVRGGEATTFPRRTADPPLTGDAPSALWSHPTRSGYWTSTRRGQVASYGGADAFGDVANLALRAPITGGAASPTGEGYRLVATDGGVFAFGDAAFAGSMASQRLNAPVVGIASDPDGSGYWLVAADGGVFAFDAPFLGSMAQTPLQAPIVGLQGYAHGYALVAADGGVFVFGDAPFLGAPASGAPAAAVVAIAAFADPVAPTPRAASGPTFG